MDLYKTVPKGFTDNLEYRIKLRKACEDVSIRSGIVEACKSDVLFFFNAFCWLYEPRPKIVNGKKLPMQIPFITWEHQDPAILKVKQNLGIEDIGVEKSRGEGFSWISVLLALHDWLFEPMSAIGLVSRNELAVDNPNDPDSLFWKIDWEITKLPKWMVPASGEFKRNLSEHTLINYTNGSSITGYASTGDVASGGRKKWMLLDELSKFPRGPDREAMASTQHVTNSRLVVSTPKGSDGAYFDLMHEPSSMVKISIDWKQNPSKNRGLYTISADGIPKAVDPVGNPIPESYTADANGKLPTDTVDLFSRLRKKGYKLEGVLRSPWYDHECDRPGATPQNIAQELDRDYGGSMHRVFLNDFMTIAEEGIRQPTIRGNASWHPEKLEIDFSKADNGNLQLWIPLDLSGKPAKGAYVVGVDVATGLGGSYSSNSSICVINQMTMEQVAEYACNTISPEDLADLAVSICKWFNNAYLAIESNGPGAACIRRVISTGYGNLYHRPVLWKKGRKKTKEVGWWTDQRTKEAAFSELSRSVRSRDFVIRSSVLLKECGQYVRVNGKIEHALAINTEDDSSKGMSHGDRVIACAVALQGSLDRPIDQTEVEKYSGEPPVNTMASRQKDYENSLQEKELDVWDGRTMCDMLSE